MVMSVRARPTDIGEPVTTTVPVRLSPTTSVPLGSASFKLLTISSVEPLTIEKRAFVVPLPAGYRRFIASVVPR